MYLDIIIKHLALLQDDNSENHK